MYNISNTAKVGFHQRKERTIMKKSLNAWTVDEKTGMRETFALVKAAGFDGIELNVDSLESASKHKLTLETTRAELDEIKKYSEEYGLPVVSISSSIWRGMAENHDYCERLMTKQLECAAALGAKGILTVPGGMNENVTLKKAYESSLEFVTKMVPVIEASGVYCGLENVWNTFFTSPYEMAYFIDATGSDRVCAYYDVGNVVAFSTTEHWIEVLGSRIQMVHVKDFKRTNGGINSGGAFVDFFEGSVNWQKAVKELKKAGFDGYLTAEVFKGGLPMSFEDYYAKTSRSLDQILEFEH